MMMPFPPFFEYHTTYHGFDMILGAVLAVVLMVTLTVSLAFFLLKAFGLYHIASRRGIRKAWLSWVPVGQDWIRGSISDQYRYFHNGKIQHRRVLLTILSAVYLVLYSAGIILLLRHLYYAAVLLMGHGSPEMAGYHVARVILAGGGMGFVTAAAWIARTVVHHMCMYDLYASTDPRNDGAMTLLAILLPILEPIFLIYVRDKDEGMPPRREPGQRPGPQPEPEQPVDADYDSPEDEGPTQL